MDVAADGDGRLNPLQDPVPTSEELVEFEPRMRRLARRLVTDPNDAEDLAQDGWVRALRHPPAHGQALGAWVERIVRSAAITHFHKAALRSSANPRFAEPAGTGATPEQALEHREIARDVWAALEELGPTYAKVLKLRFLEDRSAREIAALQGLPVETVRTQIKRGLSRMRASLDRKWGDRNSWYVALMAWSRDPTRATSSVGLTLLIGAASFSIAWLASSPSARPVPPTFETAATPAEIPSGIDRTASESLRIAMEGPATKSAAISRPALLRVRARSAGSGEALPGLLVRAEHVGRLDWARPSLRTDREGELALFDLVPGTWRIVPARGSPLLVSLEEGSEQEVMLVVDEGLRVDGMVVFPDGRPAAEVEVCATFPGSITEGDVLALADEQGRFELRGVDRFSWIYARHPSCRATTMRIAADVAGRADPLILELRSHSALRGVVVDTAGCPVAGASVQVFPVEWIAPGFERGGVLSCQPPNPVTKTGLDGGFELSGLLLRHSLMRVRCNGFEEASQQLNLVAERARGLAGDPFRVVLSPRPDGAATDGEASIRGVVQDAQGTMLPGRVVAAIPARGEPPEPLAALPLRSLLALETASETDGSFCLRVDQHGDYDLFVLPQDDRAVAGRAAARVRSGSEGIVLRTSDEPGATVIGQVKACEGEWTLVVMTSQEAPIPRSVEPDAEGRFRFESLPAGAWSPYLLRHDGLDSLSEAVLLRSGDSVDLGSFGDPGRGAVGLTVSSSEGGALEIVQAVLRGRGRTVRLVRPEDDFDPGTVVSATDLASGVYELECWAVGMRRESLQVEVFPDRTTPVAVELVPGVYQRMSLYAEGHERLQLVLRDTGWNCVARFDVTLDQGQVDAVLTNDPGEYGLQVFDGESTRLERPVSLRAGRHATLLLDLYGH